MKIKDKIRDKLRQWLLADELLKFDMAKQICMLQRTEKGTAIFY